MTGEIRSETVAQMLLSVADVALVLDKKGIVRDLMCTSSVFPKTLLDSWIGRPFGQIVTEECVEKVKDLLAGPNGAGEPWRQVNHPLGETDDTVLMDIPVTYTVVPLEAGRKLAVGHESYSAAQMQQRLVEAQQDLEEEYSRIRQVDARYRALFSMTSEAILLVDGAKLTVMDANEAALALLDRPLRRVRGKSLTSLFAEESGEALRILTAAVRTAPQAEPAHLKTADTKSKIDVSMSILRNQGSSIFLVKLSAPHTGREAGGAATPSRMTLVNAITHIPDGFVVARENRRIVSANPAFLELAQLATEQQVTGELLESWLGRSRVDIDIMLANLRERGALHRYSTVVRGQYGAEQEVELSASVIPETEPMSFGLCLRAIHGAASMDVSDQQQSMPRSVEQMTELVGRVPLKDLVRETTDIIERLCIEAALELTDDNRASAAEMLGLSRQSFYVKLRRFGLVDANRDGAD